MKGRHGHITKRQLIEALAQHATVKRQAFAVGIVHHSNLRRLLRKNGINRQITRSGVVVITARNSQ